LCRFSCSNWLHSKSNFEIGSINLFMGHSTSAWIKIGRSTPVATVGAQHDGAAAEIITGMRLFGVEKIDPAEGKADGNVSCQFFRARPRIALTRDAHTGLHLDA